MALTSCEDTADQGSVMAAVCESGAFNSNSGRKEAHADVRCFPVKGLAMGINASSWAHYQAGKP